MVKSSEGHYSDAIEDFDRAIELKPSYAESFNDRGLAKLKTGDKQGACRDFARATELGLKAAELNRNVNCQ